MQDEFKDYQNFSLLDFEETPLGDSHPSLTPTPPQQHHQSKANLDILLHKVLNNHELNDIELQQLSEEERIMVETAKQRVVAKRRRPDQYHKLFYKRAFKFAEKEFFKRGRKNKSRKMSTFYHHHFGQLAQKLNVPLANFYHPDKKTRPGLRTGQKSFNISYVRLLLHSPTFRQVTVNYHQQFRKECLKEREAKVGKLCKYISRLFQLSPHQPEKVIQALKSPKCKIPWSNLDIQEAEHRAGMELKGGGDIQQKSIEKQQWEREGEGAEKVEQVDQKWFEKQEGECGEEVEWAKGKVGMLQSMSEQDQISMQQQEQSPE